MPLNQQKCLQVHGTQVPRPDDSLVISSSSRDVDSADVDTRDASGGEADSPLALGDGEKMVSRWEGRKLTGDEK